MLDIFDLDITLGVPSVPFDSEHGFFESEQEILAAMDRYTIERGVVRHVYGREYSPEYGNAEIEKLQSRRLEKCYTLLPNYTEELGSAEKIIEELVFRRVRFVTFYPEIHGFYFSSHTCGPLLGGIADAEIVLLLQRDQIEYERMYEICNHIPELHLIVLDVGYRDNRDIYPLMGEVENIYVAISRYCGIGFIKDTVDRFGPHRLLFSGGMPLYSPGAPLTALLYADINDDYKQMIGGNNIRSILGEIDES